MGEPMDERAEADPLDDAADAQAHPLHRDRSASRLQADAPAALAASGGIPRADCGIPARRSRGCTDARRRWCRIDAVSDRAGHARADPTPRPPSSISTGCTRSSAYSATAAICVVGPTRRDGAIVYEEIASADELPAGWTEVQEAATYRLERRDDEARFGYPVGPHSWKRWLLPARVRLWQARRGDGGTTEFVEEPPPEQAVRASSASARATCTRSPSRTASSSRAPTSSATTPRRREGAFLVAVNCGTPGGTCFCTSMGTGPRAESGFDLALTELLDGEHRFLVEVGQRAAAPRCSPTCSRGAASEDDVEAALAVTHEAIDAHGPPRRVVRPPRPARAQRASTRASRRPPSAASPAATARSSARRASAPRSTTSTCSQTGAAERWRRWDSCYSQSTTRTSTAAAFGPRRGRATASGSRTSSAPGSTSSARPAASAAGAASRGARSGST